MTCPLYIPRAFSPSRLSPAMKNTHYSPSGLAILSRHKLEQEAAAEEPDLRRCLGHNSVFANTMSKTRRNSDRYRKSFRLCEEDMEASSGMKKEKDQDKGSLIRAQITKTVKAMMVRRRSMTATPANTTTTDTNINTTAGRKEAKLVQIPVTDNKTNKNTSTANNNKLNTRTVQFKDNNRRMTPPPTPASTPSPAKNVLSAKSRQCMALVTGRKFWMHSMMVQTSAG